MDEKMKEKMDDLPPVYKAMFAQGKPPEGQGNGSFVFNWKMIFIVIPFCPYLLGYCRGSAWEVILLVYSILMILLQIKFIHGIKEKMAHELNPVSFVTVTFIAAVQLVCHYGLTYYFLWRTMDSHFTHGPGTLSALDTIYYSFVTIVTVGYGDIVPASPLSKMLTMLEICVGVWLLATILPVAVADQAERIRHFRIAKAKMLEEMEKAIEKGEMVQVN